MSPRRGGGAETKNKIKNSTIFIKMFSKFFSWLFSFWKNWDTPIPGSSAYGVGLSDPESESIGFSATSEKFFEKASREITLSTTRGIFKSS